MSYDLALSPSGDLIFSGNRDIQGVSGMALIEQRMRTRLRLLRGQWQFDPEGRLGSRLYTLTGKAPDLAAQQAPMFVREALRDMEEIEIDDVLIDTTSRDIQVHVKYHLVGDDENFSAPDINFNLVVSVPVGG